MWLENCLNTIQQYNGLLGTIGIRFQTKETYWPAIRIGWDRPNQETQQVQLVSFHHLISSSWCLLLIIGSSDGRIIAMVSGRLLQHVFTNRYAC